MFFTQIMKKRLLTNLYVFHEELHFLLQPASYLPRDLLETQGNCLKIFLKFIS